MSEAIRVILDAATLGYGVEPGWGRAGTYRAAEEFVIEALRRPDLDVHVVAADSFFREVQLSRYERTSRRLGSRLLEMWHHPSVSHDDVAALIDRVVELGEMSPAGRKLMAEVALSNRLATPVAAPGEFDVYQSLRSPIVDRSRVVAHARAVVVHDLIPLLHPEWCYDDAAAAMRAILASIDRERDWVFCPSECTRRDVLAELEIDPDRIFVVPWGVDEAVFHPVDDDEGIAAVRRRYGIGNAPYVLSVCTIEPRKNLGHLVHCFARLIEQPAHADLQLVLVGALGWKTASSLEAAGIAGVRDHVRWPGFVPDEDLAALYAGADVFACASLYEGFGLPVLEAMRCAVPVISTAGGALPEVVGDAGIVVDELDDPEALTAALAAARGNRDLAAAGLERAKRYTWERTLDLTVAAYRAILRRT
jgi:glycosyltransferase involved in cell wall biosynthesis